MSPHETGSPSASSGLFERRFDIRFALKPFRDWQFLRTQKVGIEQLRLIAGAIIGKNGNDRLARAKILGQPDGAGDIDAGRAAEAEPLLLEQIENNGQRFLIGNEIGLVDL